MKVFGDMLKGDWMRVKKSGSSKKESVADKIIKISDPFLRQPKSAEEIRVRIKDKLGHSIKISDIRVNLLYLLRREKLQRETDADGEYKYSLS